ncbi:hypothetical protein ACH5RR_032757 [Cinchona calisaya]|uniref:Transmembrane protein n=1 Tax=Cinchona calisaya TaxID=153742 RepID=A0ABD2YMJ9_9GENT
MASSFCIMQKLIAAFSFYGVLSIFLTSLVLFISTVVFSFSRPKNQEDQEEDDKVKTESTIFQEKAVQKEGFGGEADQIHLDSYSESEKSIDDDKYSSSSDQDSDILLGQSPECSDDSISDEESLIEIALPSGHYVGGLKEENPMFSLQQKFQDFSYETKVFHQQSIKQIFAEFNDMNEEENLIEIDLSMGSIKCSSFEIEA